MPQSSPFARSSGETNHVEQTCKSIPFSSEWGTSEYGPTIPAGGRGCKGHSVASRLSARARPLGWAALVGDCCRLACIPSCARHTADIQTAWGVRRPREHCCRGRNAVAGRAADRAMMAGGGRKRRCGYVAMPGRLPVKAPRGSPTKGPVEGCTDCAAQAEGPCLAARAELLRLMPASAAPKSNRAHSWAVCPRTRKVLVTRRSAQRRCSPHQHAQPTASILSRCLSIHPSTARPSWVCTAVHNTGILQRALGTLNLLWAAL
eukprot:gene16896-biopygen1247